MKFKRAWIYLLSFSLLIILITFTVPERIFFSKSSNRIVADTLTLVFVFLSPLIFVLLIFPKKFVQFYIGFIVFGFIGYISGNFYKNDKAKRELSVSATSVTGVVRDKRYVNSIKGTGHWEFFCEFVYNNKVYKTFYENDVKNKIGQGDSLHVLFLTRNPEISKIVLPNNYE